MKDTYQVTTTQNKIDAKKESINRLFTAFWFRVPDYQRSYVWEKEQIEELMEDLTDALSENREKEYFLGSIVLQKYQETDQGMTYHCYDLLDGQQRVTTLFLLMAVLRDLSTDELLKDTTKTAIYQKKDPFANRPERIRIRYLIRDNVGGFIDDIIKKDGGTKSTSALNKATKSENISISNMAKNVLLLRDLLSKMEAETLNEFAIFLFNKVNIIYVSSETLDDAFKLFTILNSRGIPLTTSDILKSINIGALEKESSRKSYAKGWEAMESQYGREQFDQFLGFVRSIILKEKPTDSLLKEFEKIYRQGDLKKGQETLKLIYDCKKNYNSFLRKSHFLYNDSYQLSNLLTVMKNGLSSEIWVAPFLAYCNKFHDSHLLEFVERLESKAVVDWLLSLTPNQRRGNMYSILKLIDRTDNPQDVIIDRKAFSYDKLLVEERLNDPIYKAAYGRYVLLKIEYLLKDQSQSFSAFTKISIEHVLPQKPRSDSQWKKDFNEEKARFWTDKLANLVLLSRRKNSKLNNKDFTDKKSEYFKSSINTFPNVNQVMQRNRWTPRTLSKRQKELISLLMGGFK